MTADQIADSLKLTRTTCYRYTRELSHAGLLVNNAGRYILGPRIIELDHRIILSDPLLNAGRSVITSLANSLGATGLLTTSYDDRIINIFEHQGSSPRLPLSFGRGTLMPTFRSSSSKVILASLSRSRLKRLWKLHQHEPDCRAIGADWLTFWKNLQTIKRQGYWTSTGELDGGLAGVSTPILFANGDVAGSLSVVFALKAFRMYDTALLGARLRGAAAEVSAALETTIPPSIAEPADRPPSAPSAPRRRTGPAGGTETKKRRPARPK